MDKLPHEYDGLSEDKVTVPPEAEPTRKDSWKILLCILACAAPLVAAGVFLILKLTVPAAICAGVFAIAVTVFLVTLFAAEKRLLNGVNVLNKPDTRKITATVVGSVCTSRAYQNHRDVYGRFTGRELVYAVYAITLKEDGDTSPKTYVAKTKKYYTKGEVVAAYVRGKFAFIDETDPLNAQKTSARRN